MQVFKSLCTLLCLLATLPLLAQQVGMGTKTDSLSYALGTDIARSLKRLDVPLSPDMIYQGLSDVLDSGSVAQLTTEQAQALIQAFQQEAQRQQQAKAQAEMKMAQAAEDSFLAQNAEQEGIIALPSGLQYKVLEAGDGPKPTVESTVKVHYEGRLLDGTVFDSSYERGEPIEFPVGRVISGWTEGLQLMPVGSKWQLYIPSKLGYGPQGAPPTIGPNATLVFDVELLEIVE
jgi:FKBP-type peptidyl-prolyl cis-trans isomerase